METPTMPIRGQQPRRSSSRRVGGSRLVLIAICVLAGLVCACSSTKNAGPAGSTPAGSGSPSSDAASARKPNILFILTDDMRFDDLQFMPHVRELIGEQGMSFESQFDNVTLCCPARVSILKGQYSHNTGILTNNGSNGGFETAYSANVEDVTIATALQDAGYATGLFGKYLNGYPNSAGIGYVPPGWDTWSSATKGNAYGQYNYTLNENGKQVAYGGKPEDYGTTVYVRQVKEFMARARSDGKPFFAYLSVYAPHQPATAAPEDTAAFPGLKAPRDSAFNEGDVGDKPQYIQRLPLLTLPQQRNLDDLYRRRAQSLQAVDRGVADLVDQLAKDGELANTYIVFTSDNGFHLGQHRMPSGKQTPYETDIHLPLLVRGPGVAAGSHVDAITGNIDLAPTFAELGGATLRDNPDGWSLAPFLSARSESADGRIATPSGWRQAYLLEHWTSRSTGGSRTGGAQLEPGDPDQGSGAPGNGTPGTGSAPVVENIPEFQGLRVAGYTYVEYATGERELYDLNKDPGELNNIAKTAGAALIETLHRRLQLLRTCSGDSCRRAESEPLALSP